MTNDDARREQDAAHHDRLPFPTLLSRALVAYTIEFDNEFEHQMPHRTADDGATPAAPYTPWLTSAAYPTAVDARQCRSCRRGGDESTL